MRAILVGQHGGPEVLTLGEAPIPEPGPGQARVKVAAVGLNFIEIYQRLGWYKIPLPWIPGGEAAGVVDAVGPGVTEVKVGDRVASSAFVGAYAEYAIANAWQLAIVPDGVDLTTAAAAMLQGMTAHYLTQTIVPLRAGLVALLHAAAGGVGLLLTQLAKRAGARVIGTVSTEAKADLAKAAGADHVINYTTTDFAAEVKRLTGGRGVDVVYDSVGQATFDGSLASLAPRGCLVLFGQSSGVVPPFDPARLAKGSYFLTRPSLGHYTATRSELLGRARHVLDLVTAGHLRVRIDRTFPLAEAAAAHRALTGRATAGKVLLLP